MRRGCVAPLVLTAFDSGGPRSGVVRVMALLELRFVAAGAACMPLREILSVKVPPGPMPFAIQPDGFHVLVVAHAPTPRTRRLVLEGHVPRLVLKQSSLLPNPLSSQGLLILDCGFVCLFVRTQIVFVCQLASRLFFVHRSRLFLVCEQRVVSFLFR